MSTNWRKVDEGTKAALMVDHHLHAFLEPVFSDAKGRENFIAKCLKKDKTRHMLLRAQWYTEIADDIGKIRLNRPALQLIFLMAMAEALAKERLNNRAYPPSLAAKAFFQFLMNSDKKFILQKIRRSLLKFPHHSLRLSSILRILYETRNQAVHGEDYYSFLLPDEEEAKKHHNTFMTFGTLVSKKKKRRRVSLDIGMSYGELRDVFRRTAIENMKACF